MGIACQWNEKLCLCFQPNSGGSSAATNRPESKSNTASKAANISAPTSSAKTESTAKKDNVDDLLGLGMHHNHH